ncbi:hypothetical protein LINPERHAP1_LOCUS41028 [Linum perenne]
MKLPDFGSFEKGIGE